jgi:hypothetical protein
MVTVTDLNDVEQLWQQDAELHEAAVVPQEAPPGVQKPARTKAWVGERKRGFKDYAAPKSARDRERLWWVVMGTVTTTRLKPCKTSDAHEGIQEVDKR